MGEHHVYYEPPRDPQRDRAVGVIARAIERCDWYIDRYYKEADEAYAARDFARWGGLHGAANAAGNIKRILEGHDGD